MTPLTTVSVGPYQGFHIKNFESISAPNPRCCSNPQTLCPACAVKALKARGFTANELVANAVNDYPDDDGAPTTLPAFLANETDDECDDDEGLSIPTINWAEVAKGNARQCECQQDRTAPVVHEQADGDGLPLPTIDWVEAARQNRV